MGSRNRKGKGKGPFPRRGRRGLPSSSCPPAAPPSLWPLRYWGPSELDLLTSTPFSKGYGYYARLWNRQKAHSLAEEQYREAGIDPQGEILLKDVAGLLRSLREEGECSSLVLEALARMVTDEPEAARMLVLNGRPGEWDE